MLVSTVCDDGKGEVALSTFLRLGVNPHSSKAGAGMGAKVIGGIGGGAPNLDLSPAVLDGVV